VSQKKYGGYSSYSHLKEGEDYQAIPLAKEIDRVPSAKVELSEAEEKRARAILDGQQIVSMHDHTSIFPEDMGRMLEQRRQGRDATLTYVRRSHGSLEAYVLAGGVSADQLDRVRRRLISSGG